MGLSKYYQKRDFKKTTEPRGREHKSSKSLRFVIQKHAASHLHYDFRLEMEGVLRSWAVPKGPSLDPTVKRLAMHVEDHPIEYGTFEGIIPKGEYGGGTVLLWDRGEWEPRGNPVEMYHKGRLKFTLKGEKLQGGWSLVRMGGDEKSWLLFKERDEEAKPKEKYDVTEKRPESVATGRVLEQIAEDQDRVWNSNREEKVSSKPKTAKQKSAVQSCKPAPARKSSDKLDPSKLKGAVKAPFPDEIEPQLATLVKQAPTGEDCFHEIKLDGYRMILYVDGKNVCFISRNGNDWTGNYPALVKASRDLSSSKVILDGEVVAFDEKGRTSFQILQNAQSSGAAGKLAFLVFDILYLDGYDLRRAAAIERKELLRKFFEASAVSDDRIRYCDHFDESGETVFQHACSFALEGIISKRKDAPYAGGRNRNWVKVKCISRQEFIIGGYTPPGGSRNDIGALLVGVKDKAGKLRFSGKVGTGFTAQTLRDLKQKFTELHQDESPFVDPPRGAAFRGVQWLKPVLVGEVEFTEWTDEGKLRHPSFQGLRDDKPAEEVVEEKPKPLDENGSKARGKSAAAKKETAKKSTAKKETAPKAARVKSAAKSSSAETEVAGVRLTSPDKVMYPEQGITKRDLAEYYASVSKWILPHIEHRPLTLVRCPQGRGKCFYQKHAGDSTPEILERIEIEERDGPDTYLALDSAAGLVALVQMGVLEIHVWGSRVEKLEHPDQVIFDLDPDPTVSYKEVVEGAVLLREMLKRAGLVPFVKTTGGKGLHIVVPLNSQNTWDEVKMFAELVASLIVAKEPKKYLAVASKAERKGKIFIDYLRNGRGATAIAPYSTRAREGAPVSVPLAWEELKDPKIKPETFNVRNIHDRLGKLKKDPWKEFNKSRKKITPQVLKQISA